MAVERDPASHILAELGLATSVVGDQVHGQATVIPEMFVPATSSIRTSILVTWADTVAGLAAVRVLSPSVPVTLELDMHVYREPRDLESVSVRSQVVKAGKAVIVVDVDLTADGREPLALANASFMGAPDRTLKMDTSRRLSSAVQPNVLQVPLAERARCTRPAPGVASVPFSSEGSNSSKTLNGGLLALAIEEAVLSLASPGVTLASMALRYLRPVRVGPAVATAEVGDGLGRVEVRDAGRDDRLAAIATTRTFDPPV